MIRSLTFLIVGALVLGSLIAPLMYSWAQSWSSPPDWPYSRVFNRAAMLSLLIMLVALRKRFDFHGVKSAFRLGRLGERSRDFSVGLVLSAGAALVAIPLVVGGGQMEWSGTPWGTLLWSLAAALPAAALVSVIEEGFFRVLIFDSLRARMNAILAALVGSLFYASLHFLAPAKDFVYPGWSLTVGFEYLGRVFSRYALPGVWAGMVGLLLIGLVLCWTIRTTRSIYLCIGLHAGWFFAAKAAVFLANVAPGAELPAGVDERYFLVGRPWTWLSILLVGLCVWALRIVYWPRSRPATNQSTILPSSSGSSANRG